MSRALVVLGALISVLCMKAVAGWVCDGTAQNTGGSGGAPASTNVAVYVQDVGGTSVVYAVTSTGHTNLVGRFRSE